MSLRDRLRAMIEATGPVGFDVVVEVALYDAAGGFYEAGGRAGRRGGDFITSPEVGPLFGAVIARALDAWWRTAGSPRQFRVAEAASGRGTLARTIKVAEPACMEALDYVMVETSAAQRRLSEGIGPQFRTAAELPGEADVVLANELLDNLAFRIARSDGTGKWSEVLLAGVDDETLRPASFREITGPWVAPLPDEIAAILAGLDVAVGTDVPLVVGARDWIAQATASADRVVCFDYGASTAELAARDDRGWLRCYRDNVRAELDLTALGTQDITTDVPLDQLPQPSRISSQSNWLQAHGIADLVAQGQQIWAKRAGVGDLGAIRARSRKVEAEALVDPTGLGGFAVLEWESGNTHENSLI